MRGALFSEFCRVIGIPNASQLLAQKGTLNFVNKFYIPAFYKAVPYNNLDAFNPNSRSNFYKGWDGFRRGTETYAEKVDDVIDLFMKKRGALCFHRCIVSSLVLNDAGIDSYTGLSIARREMNIPHNLIFVRNATTPGSLHMGDLGNRFSPMFEIVDMEFERESVLSKGPISESKVIRTNQETDSNLMPYQQTFRKLSQPDANFSYYFDFDTNEMDTFSEDKSEIHFNFSESDGSPCKSFGTDFQDLLMQRMIGVIGIDKAGRFTEYANNTVKRYDKEGYVTELTTLPNKQSLVNNVVKDFPQFTETIISNAIDSARENGKYDEKYDSLWPQFS